VIFFILILIALWVVQDKYLRSVYLGIFAILLIVELFYYINRSNRDLNNFFQSVLHNDYSSHLRDSGKGKSFRELYDTLNEINERLSLLSSEKESHTQYLISMIEQVRVGMLSVDANDQVQLVNMACKDLLNLPGISAGTNIRKTNPELMSIIDQIRIGEHQLIKWKVKEEEKPFSFQVTGFKSGDQEMKLVSIHDIRAELDEKELEAWQKLIRVLTHEIMNSVTPVVSLSSSLNDLVHDHAGKIKDEFLEKKLKDGLEAITERSSGLMNFTEAFRNLTRLPAPKIANVRIDDLIKRIETLLKPQLQQFNTTFNIVYDGKPSGFKGDIDLLEQVVINLVKNAMEAVEGVKEPRIDLIICDHEESKVKIIIKDNGPGIDPEIQDKIFIPFFSTKENGTGIGLSLSRQIVLMHRGILEVKSLPKQGSEFEIIL